MRMEWVSVSLGFWMVDYKFLESCMKWFLCFVYRIIHLLNGFSSGQFLFDFGLMNI